jgi:microcystin degradation protein MlrC
MPVKEESSIDVLIGERRRLIGRIEQESEQLETLQAVVEDLANQLGHDERALREIESVLGKTAQLQLEDSDIRLRGRRLEEVAIAVLAEAEGTEPIHYRVWFELLRSRGHLIAGKRPIDTFLAQINRSNQVENVGRRSGLYRLAAA